MEEAAPHQTGLAPEVRCFVERVGAGEKVTDDGAWFAGEHAEAETARPYNMTDLFNVRELILKTAKSYQPRDVNGRALRQLVEAVDDTIGQLVEASGNADAIPVYQKMRNDYRQKAWAFDDPAVQASLEGRLDDVYKAIADPQTGPESIRAMKQALGDEAWLKFSDDSLRRKVANYLETDDYEGLLRDLETMGEPACHGLYGKDASDKLLDMLRSRNKNIERSKAAQDALLQADKTRDAALEELEKQRHRQIKVLEAERDEKLRQINAAGANGTANLKPTIGATSIGGWLLLLIVRLWIGTAVRVIGGLAVGFSFLGLFSFASAALAGIAAYLLGRKNGKGVLIAKIFLATDASYYLLALISSMFGGASNESGALPPWFKPTGYLIACVLWFAYLIRSERVKNTYFPVSVQDNTIDKQVSHPIGTLLTKTEFEKIKSTLETRVTDRLREMVSNPADKYHDYVNLLNEHGDTDAIETIRRRQVSAVMSLCDHAYSMHLSPSPMKIPDAPDPNGSFSKELQNWSVGASAVGMVRALDIRAAMEVKRPFELMIQDQDYLLAIVRKNAGDPGTGIGKMDMAEYEGRTGPEIAYLLIIQASQDMFESEMWAYVAHYAGDEGFLNRYEKAAGTASKDSLAYWGKELLGRP